MDRYGTVDVLINNAGQGLHVPIEDIKLDDLAAVMELNVQRAEQVAEAILRAVDTGEPEVVLAHTPAS